MQAMSEGDVEAAAELFENPEWKATANYRGEKFEDAASQFGGINTADGKYNLGNAFAKQGLLDEAIEAYDQALTIDPDNEDAQFNKELIEQLQQQQQEQQQDQDQDGEDSEEQQDQGTARPGTARSRAARPGTTRAGQSGRAERRRKGTAGKRTTGKRTTGTGAEGSAGQTGTRRRRN